MQVVSFECNYSPAVGSGSSVHRNHSWLCVGMFACETEEMLPSHAADGWRTIANPHTVSLDTVYECTHGLYLHSPTVTCSSTQADCCIAKQQSSCDCNTTRTVTTPRHLSTSVISNYRRRSTPDVRVEVRAQCCECVQKRLTGVKTVQLCAPVE